MKLFRVICETNSFAFLGRDSRRTKELHRSTIGLPFACDLPESFAGCLPTQHSPSPTSPHVI